MEATKAGCWTERREVWLPGEHRRPFHDRRRETDRGFSLVEHPMSPRALAARFQAAREDEYTYVLEGKVGGSARR
jgi:hypothetical protein